MATANTPPMDDDTPLPKRRKSAEGLLEERAASGGGKTGGGKQRGLGRGLSALFGEQGEDYAALDKVKQTRAVPIEQLTPNRYQPRRHFDTAAIDELALSIKANGVLQPLLVRRDPDQPSRFEIIAGERRWRAAQKAQLHELPVVVRDIDDRAAAELALIENVQRRDLSPFEEADGYRRLLEEFEYTQEQLAKSVGKSRSHIANLIRLLALPLSVRILVEDGKLTAGQVRPLINNPEAETLAQQVLDQGLNARQAEQLALGALKAAPPPIVQAAGDPSADGLAAADDDLLDGVDTGPWPDLGPSAAQPPNAAANANPDAAAHARLAARIKDPNVAELEEKLTDALGLKVEVAGTGDKGQLRIVYTSMEQLGNVVRLLSGSIEEE